MPANFFMIRQGTTASKNRMAVSYYQQFLMAICGRQGEIANDRFGFSAHQPQAHPAHQRHFGALLCRFPPNQRPPRKAYVLLNPL